MTPPPDQEKIKKSLRVSLWDGVFACSMTGFTQEYLVPFILLSGAASQHIGLLSCLPNLAGALIQLKSPELTEKFGSRKKIIVTFVFLQALMFLPMFYVALQGGTSPMLFIIFVTAVTGLGAVALPAWGSLMSDLVKENVRGTYFGWRSKILGLTTVGMSFVAGNILHFTEGFNVYVGFAYLFFMAFIFRLMSCHFLTQMHEPPLVHKKEHAFTLGMFLRRVKESNFAKFVLFVASLNFCVNMASPFFAVFMLRDLHFNYFLFTSITITAPLTVYLLMSRWGRHADKVGNLKVLQLTAPIVSLLPVLWIISQNPVYLFLTQIIAGFAWAGFNLCASNFIFDAVTPEKRTRCIAYFNVFNGLALCCGALLGGLIAEHLPPLLGHKLLTLFLISSIGRLFIAVFIPRRLKEVRNVEHVKSNRLFFSMVGVKPLLGIERRIVRIDQVE
ncbi:MAG: hypothetical protein A2Z88_07770 [Omnitrophica WOR_2 bacterium GWA2_47_8]|nr:MAG: hypothetical protein A2Z88_07770 [Omnitrophica WOR_2 bacterium GWA2_47_8]